MRTIAFILSLVLIFMIPWEDVASLPGLGSVARSIGLVTALFWMLTVITTGRLRQPTPFHLLACLFVLWNILSILWSSNPDQTLGQIVTFIQLLGLTFVFWDLYTTRTMLWAGLGMYILGAYIALGDTVVNFIAGSTFYYERFSAYGTNPDDLALTLANGIPIAFFLAMSIDNGKVSVLAKVLNYAYIPAAFLGIALTGTRTALIATMPGLLFGIASMTRLKPRIQIAVFLFVILVGYFTLPYVPQSSLQRLGSTGSELASGDLNGRIEIWQQGFASFVKHPLIGVGSNMFRATNTAGKVLGKVAHNSFISILVEVGLIGLALFLLLLANVISQAWHQTKWNAGFWLAMLATWLIGASTLTLENRKLTWLFLTMVIISANLVQPDDESVTTTQHLSQHLSLTSDRLRLAIKSVARVGRVA